MGTRPLQPGKKGSLRLEHQATLAFFALVFAGCTAPVAAGEEPQHMGRSIQPIVGGAASGTDQDAVVVLARFDGGARVGLCTATLLASNLVVTARHCVSATDPSAACGTDGAPQVGAMLHGDRAPETLAVFTANAGVAPDTTTDTGAKAHGKMLVVDAASTICNHDIAFVVLDRPVTMGEPSSTRPAPIAPIRLGVPMKTEPLTAVGFGITETGVLPASRMQRVGLSLVGAGPMAFPDDARYGIGDAEFLIGESACAGDSGGPALASSGAVLGVASRVGNGAARDPNNAASTCLGTTAHAVYADLGAARDLVDRAYAAAGAKPWLEGEPDPRLARAPGLAGAHGSRGATATPAPTTAAGVVTPAAEEPSASSGCSAAGEPTSGAVENTVGILFGILLLNRLRSARRHRRADQRHSEIPNGRMPYRDLGMRESLASLSDDR